MAPDYLDGSKGRTRAAWNLNAEFWDRRMGDAGNDFQRLLVWAPTERLLAVKPGERVLDAACGNGNFSRRLAAMGAEVVAFDFAERMIERARSYKFGHADRIKYLVIDATNPAQLAELGGEKFDAAVSNMALMDMAEIEPLVSHLALVIRPGGRFVFSVMHPCFNANSVLTLEQEERDGDVVQTYSVKVGEYLRPRLRRGRAFAGQPEPQYYYDRPLGALLGACFAAGLVLDALEEPAFPSDLESDGDAPNWGPKFSQIPPALVVRLRVPASL